MGNRKSIWGRGLNKIEKLGEEGEISNCEDELTFGGNNIRVDDGNMNNEETAQSRLFGERI